MGWNYESKSFKINICKKIYAIDGFIGSLAKSISTSVNHCSGSNRCDGHEDFFPRANACFRAYVYLSSTEPTAEVGSKSNLDEIRKIMKD